jgi:arylformamidase
MLSILNPVGVFIIHDRGTNNNEVLIMLKYIDLSLPVDGGLHSNIEFRKILTYEKDGAQVTSFAMSAHTCTHLDAPLHVMGPDAASIDTFPVDYFIADAALLDIPRIRNQAITEVDLEKAGKHAKDGDIVLIRTGWIEKMLGREGFEESPYLTEDAAEWLIKLKARIAGYDFIQEYALRNFRKNHSVKPADCYVHLKLLGNGVLNLEHLNNLSKLSKPRFKLIALPILLKGCEAAPARVVAIEDWQ